MRKVPAGAADLKGSAETVDEVLIKSRGRLSSLLESIDAGQQRLGPPKKQARTESVRLPRQQPALGFSSPTLKTCV